MGLHIVKTENQVYQMFGVKTHKALIWSVISSILILTSCAEDLGDNLINQHFIGETQGTTYSVILVGEAEPITKLEIDSLLNECIINNILHNQLQKQSLDDGYIIA